MKKGTLWVYHRPGWSATIHLVQELPTNSKRPARITDDRARCPLAGGRELDRRDAVYCRRSGTGDVRRSSLSSVRFRDGAQPRERALITRRLTMDDALIDQLDHGPLHRFADYATLTGVIPGSGAGVYTIWDDEA